eukprot:TRINITY_DN2075_c0_g1_i1.p1 TRINITY_DN2075_c0_g1~~TRINITY_DN2075_c0_g1_i1.p1  ORF type:complete len:143 (+),score=23.05 TRINITY_DN2075_c0_g1_i1:149-577(+)
MKPLANWQDHFEVRIIPINENLLIDPRNTTGKVDPTPNGNFVIVKPKDKSVKIKGFAVQVKPESYIDGHSPVEFTMIHRNTLLKKLVNECRNGEMVLAHKDPSEKAKISFFFKHLPKYSTSDKKIFTGTILENFGKFYKFEF